MVTKKNTSKDMLRWDPSLRKTFKESKEWMDEMGRMQLESALAYIHEALSKGTRLEVTVATRLGLAGDAFGIKCCALKDERCIVSIIESLSNAVNFRSVAFRFLATESLSWEGQPALPFVSSMRVAGASMLSQWDIAEACARLFIQVAHKDQQMHPEGWRSAGWGNGTHTTFLIYLLAESFDIPTHYEPAAQFLPAYQRLLKVWRSTDEMAFREAMLQAIEFHISRSKNATERHDYEFDNYFDRVYPAELLAVQALRRRDGLPEFQTGHLLVDTPWSIIRDAEPVEPHPVFVAVQDRMRQDYPGFV